MEGTNAIIMCMMFGAWIRLDTENMKGFFERVWDYQEKYVPWQDILQENDVLLLYCAACKEFVPRVQKAFRDSWDSHLVLLDSSTRSTRTLPRRPCACRAATHSLPTLPHPLQNQRTWKSNFLRLPSGIPIRGRLGSCTTKPRWLAFRAQNLISPKPFFKFMLDSGGPIEIWTSYIISLVRNSVIILYWTHRSNGSPAFQNLQHASTQRRLR